MAIVLCAPPLCAHDFWIEPSKFLTLPGQRIEVRFRVGENLVGDPVPLNPLRFNEFVVQDGVQRKPVEGRIGSEMAGTMAVNRPGLHVVGYFSKPTTIELPADKFNTYLKEEGLESIIALRERRGQSGAKATEAYSRCVKSLILAGRPDAISTDRRLGFPLELLAEANPYLLDKNPTVPFRLFYQERPLPGALVVAINSLDPAEKKAERTDVDGRVRFQLRPGGMWLIKVVHMVEEPPGGAVEWSSYWASLTFGTRAI